MRLRQLSNCSGIGDAEFSATEHEQDLVDRAARVRLGQLSKCLGRWGMGSVNTAAFDLSQTFVAPASAEQMFGPLGMGSSRTEHEQALTELEAQGLIAPRASLRTIPNLALGWCICWMSLQLGRLSPALACCN